jgi:hypothetical protein
MLPRRNNITVKNWHYFNLTAGSPAKLMEWFFLIGVKRNYLMPQNG